MATSLESLAPESRIWIYGAERELTKTETKQVRQRARAFVEQWSSHQQSLRAAADVLHQRFLVLAVDETQAEASGCSIDGSVHFVQQLGQEIGVDFFNRMRFSYRDDAGKIHTVSREEFKLLYAQGQIGNETAVFDPLIKELGELRQIFERPLEDSWHSRMV
jgi:DNA phosphorothioation-dependent restriction protein DptG